MYRPPPRDFARGEFKCASTPGAPATDDDLARTVRNGVPNSAMPAFGEVLTAEQIRALVASVRSLASAPPSLTVETFWRRPIPPQGPPPADLAPAEASLWPDRCAKCHEKQFREWRDSLHSRAFGPGVRAQLADRTPPDAPSCQACHAPLSEQMPARAERYAGLDSQGVACAACHLRNFVRHGTDAPRAPRPTRAGYPLVRTPLFERAEFCAPCHQHEETGPNDKPLLDTFREWAQSSYLARGIPCQSCHMPDGAHAWKGVHDADSVREALAVWTELRRDGKEAIEGWVVVENRGAGHAFPTTPTPEATLRAWLEDAAGRAIGAPLVEQPIGRRVAYREGRWIELSDTRLFPGQPRRVPLRARADGAVSLRVEVAMRPDRFYEGFYETALAARPPEAAARTYREALARARAAAFIAWSGRFPIP